MSEEHKCTNIKTKLKTSLGLLKSELFGLPLNSYNIQKNAAIIENNLSLALSNNCFDEDVLIQFRLLIQNLLSLSNSLNKDNRHLNLAWFDITIKYLLIKTEIHQ